MGHLYIKPHPNYPLSSDTPRRSTHLYHGSSARVYFVVFSRECVTMSSHKVHRKTQVVSSHCFRYWKNVTTNLTRFFKLRREGTNPARFVPDTLRTEKHEKVQKTGKRRKSQKRVFSCFFVFFVSCRKWQKRSTFSCFRGPRFRVFFVFFLSIFFYKRIIKKTCFFMFFYKKDIIL